MIINRISFKETDYLHCLHGAFDQDLTDAKAGYTLWDLKRNHFFMDALKVYGKDKAKSKSLK